MDALARKFAATHDMSVKEEIERLAREYGSVSRGSSWRGETARSKHSRRTLHSLKVIVHPMLSQFYGVFLRFHLG
jgi:hypothetical protein